MRNEMLRQIAAQAILDGNNHPFAITRDEGGYLTHEILSPSLESGDWRFNESHDDDLDWGPILLEDSEGIQALSLVRIAC